MTLGLAGCVLASPSLAEAQTGWLPSPDAPNQSSRVVVGRSTTPTPSTTPSTTPTAAPPPKGRARPAAPVIVIDPGHSGGTIMSRTTHGLRDVDYSNYPEIYETWDVSTCVARALRTDGYRVTLTKKHALSSVSLADRAAIANRAKAALAVSVHDDHGQSSAFQATYSQRGVTHTGRHHAMYRGVGSHRTVFAHPTVARRSETYATKIAQARTTAQHHQVTVRENSFAGRAPLEPGNLALVQLLADVPWVYNEAGARTAGSPTRAMSISAETAYATGLLAGIEASVPLVAGRANPATTSAAGLRGCLTKQVGTPDHLTRPTRHLPYGWG